jgi:hypothetical protein
MFKKERQFNKEKVIAVPSPSTAHVASWQGRS